VLRYQVNMAELEDPESGSDGALWSEEDDF
jgi:hypothetical protein